jgi:hypothetical protein
VVNKQDTVSAEEQRVALAYVAERLERFAFSEVPRILSISARHGLHAKQSGNANELEESGLGPLEAELLRFLTEDRAQSFLSNMYGRVTIFLTQQPRLDDQAADRDAFNLLAKRLRILREKSLGAGGQSGMAFAAREDSGSAAKLQIEKRAGCWICGAMASPMQNNPACGFSVGHKPRHGIP